MKRLLFILCIQFVVIGAMAQRFSYDYKNVTFSCQLKNNKVIIKGFDQDAYDVTIPATVSHKEQDYEVEEIDTYISGNNYSTVRLTVEEGVKRIKNFSFVEFRQLNYVYLPQSLVQIGKKTFAFVDKIDVFEAPESIKIQVNRTAGNSDIYLAENEQPQEKKQAPKRKNKKQKEAERPASAEPEEPVRETVQPVVQKVDVTVNLVSDVDKDIPETGKVNENTFAVIIANENYDTESKVDYAINDGTVFKEYCIKILGIPDENIKMVIDATYMQIKRTLDLLTKISSLAGNNSKIIIYYAGHGMPDEAQNCAYLLPVDSYASDIETSGYSLKEMYRTLGKLPAQSVTVFLDACFSGMKRDGSPVVAARGIARKPKNEVLNGNVVVFSATSDVESAYSYQSKGHGLFTYFLLKKLKETQGNVSYGDLYDYLRTKVGLTALKLNEKAQTPVVSTAPNLKNIWKTINFNTNY